jgi:phosphoribosylamine--glycine ligase
VNVLIVGSGGREHALGWKISQGKHRIYFAPGNGGTSENVGIKQNDIEKLLSFAKKTEEPAHHSWAGGAAFAWHRRRI